jgi:ankyrin repeat protein
MKRRASPLADAARAGKFADVIRLLGAGHDVNGQDEYGGTALIYAVSAGDEGAVRTLIQHGADLNVVDDDGRTALEYATIFSSPDPIVRLLKARGAAPGPPIHVRGLSVKDVLNYARGSSPDMAMLRDMLRSLDKADVTQMIATAEPSVLDVLIRSLKTD